MTSRKTIAACAKAINDERITCRLGANHDHATGADFAQVKAVHFYLNRVANKLADIFRSEDIGFNRSQFLRACGFDPKINEPDF